MTSTCALFHSIPLLSIAFSSFSSMNSMNVLPTYIHMHVYRVDDFCWEHRRNTLKAKVGMNWSSTAHDGSTITSNRSTIIRTVHTIHEQGFFLILEQKVESIVNHYNAIKVQWGRLYIYRGFDGEVVPKDLTHVFVGENVTIIKKVFFSKYSHLTHYGRQCQDNWIWCLQSVLRPSIDYSFPPTPRYHGRIRSSRCQVVVGGFV